MLAVFTAAVETGTELRPIEAKEWPWLCSPVRLGTSAEPGLGEFKGDKSLGLSNGSKCSCAPFGIKCKSHGL